MLSGLDVKELLRDFRVCYDKFIVHACVVPLSNVNELMNGALQLQPGDYLLSGTKVELVSTCNMRISNRYLVNMYDGIYGMYIASPLGDCEIGLSWELHGVNARFKVSSNEAIIVLVRLMKNRTKGSPGIGIPRIIKSLGFKGRVLIHDDDLAIYLLGDSWNDYNTYWGCVDELILGNWGLVFNPCMYVSNPLGFPQVSFIIKGRGGEVRIRRYYPSLGRWYDVHNLAIKDGDVYLLSITIKSQD